MFGMYESQYVTCMCVYVAVAAVVVEDKERTCDSLLMCIVTVLSHGLRSGGGVGDVLRKPSKEVEYSKQSLYHLITPFTVEQYTITPDASITS